MDTQHGMLPSMATSRVRGLATAADLEDDRQEIVRGEIVRKASPSFGHGLTQMALGAALGGFLGRASQGRPGGWWLASEVEIELDTHEVYLPDIAGWRIERVPEPPDTRPVRVAPDWVCEILSPSTADRDLGQKQWNYHRAHVGHYWIVEPISQVLTVYRWQEAGYLLAMAAGASAVVRAEPFDAIELALGDIFRLPPCEP
jgi:Uma2 family endonuclease